MEQACSKADASGRAGESLREKTVESTAPLEAIARELTRLAEYLNAGNYRFLILLGEFDARHGYAESGCTSCAHWVSWRCGVGMVAAREKVRVARALRELPQTREAMQRGKVSYCKVRAITRIANRENEGVLLSAAERATVSEVESTVRRWREADAVTELARGITRHSSRELQAYVTHNGCVAIHGTVSPEPGSLILQALRAANDQLREAEGDSCESSEVDAAVHPRGARNADALELIARSFLAGGGSHLAGDERHLVHVHIDEQLLRDPHGSGRSEIDGHSSIAPATVKRLCCDGSLVAIVEDTAGNPHYIGRKTRVIPRAIRRALDARDGGCRFPGCTNTRFVDAHHIQHWADGGESQLENLILLCRRHHRFLHEHEYRVSVDQKGLKFERADGTEVVGPSAPSMDVDSGLAALLYGTPDLMVA